MEANGLATPVLNFLKRVVGFQVATVTSDNITVTASALAATPNTDEMVETIRVVNEEFVRLMEQNKLTALVRRFARNAAVDGDGCMYTYWDSSFETGQKKKGAIRTEIVENTRVFFGDPNTPDVQVQPYIQIEMREFVRKAKLEAKANKIADWNRILPDEDSNQAVDSVKRSDGKCSVILTMWRDEEDGKIWACKSTKDVMVKEPWCLDIKLYPIVWLNWDYIQNSYHGQSMITGLIPNQILVNKLWAMTGTSLVRTAWPKVMYDRTRIAKWDNRPGGAIPVGGGDMNTVAKIMDPAQISPQVAQLIQLIVEQTEQSLGATAAALGDTRPDNTSAIIALQRAASTPIELTKLALYQCIEDLFRINFEFMAGYYGKRDVDMPISPEMIQAMQFAGMQNIPDMIPQSFDFKVLKDHPMTMKLDVGASSYYSEIASINTLDNLLQLQQIDLVDYLERIPDGHIPDRRGLINKKKAEQTQMMMQQGMMDGMGGMTPAPEEGAPIDDQQQKDTVPTGGGYSALQRKIAQGDMTGVT